MFFANLLPIFAIGRDWNPVSFYDGVIMNDLQLTSPTTSELPAISRFTLITQDRGAAIAEIEDIARYIESGVEALSGMYLRICDIIRAHDLSDNEIRTVLESHFPPPRISEFIRVARAPYSVYVRYRAGFFGFKAALRACSGFHVTPNERLKQRRIQHAAERLAKLTGPGKLHVARWSIDIQVVE